MLVMAMITCTICGEQSWFFGDGPAASALAERGRCFTCDFWSEKAADHNNPNVARINGIQYTIVPSGPAKRPATKGFGGETFVVRFFDGRVVVTDDLWCEGKIPDRFRDALPDNAVFGTIEAAPKRTTSSTK
jgi:hypothetical protein